MKTTAKKLILVSFILALIATVTVLLYFKSLKSPDDIPIKTTVLVAVETIPPRTLIDQNMIKEIQVSDDLIFSDYIKDSSKIVGKYTNETIFANEGFNSNKLLEKYANELSLKIASDKRAMSISVTGDSGVSDLIKPGDYVDVVSYIAGKKDEVKGVRPDTAKIILQKIEVLAVDKQLNREVKGNANTDDKEKTVTNFLVTLSIPTSDVEKLVLAESIGSIKLALRPLKDDSTTKTEGATTESLYNNTDKDKTVVSEQKNNAVVSNQKDNSINVSSAASVKKKYTRYTVKRGDSLRKISQEFYGDKSKYTIIMGTNNIQDENLIKAGDVIKIPILK